jgi:hypothetical protein
MVDRQRRDNRVNRALLRAPGAIGQVEQLGSKAVAVLRQMPPRMIEHRRRSVETIDCTGRKVLQQRASQQPLAAAQLKDGKESLVRGDQIDKGRDLLLTLRHKIASKIKKCLRFFLAPVDRRHMLAPNQIACVENCRMLRIIAHIRRFFSQPGLCRARYNAA